MTCIVCLDAIDDNSFSLPECGHAYHVNCIMSWFRSGKKTCPVCMNDGSDYVNTLACYDVEARARLIKDAGNSKNAPIHLKKELNFYAESCDKITKLTDELETFMESFKGTYNDLNERINEKERRIRILKRLRNRRWKRIITKGVCVLIIPLRKTIFS